jgi:hypothetical protein
MPWRSADLVLDVFDDADPLERAAAAEDARREGLEAAQLASALEPTGSIPATVKPPVGRSRQPRPKPRAAPWVELG